MASRTHLLRRLLAVASVVLVCAMSSACWGSSNPQDTLAPRGPVAHDQKALFYPTFWIAVAVFFFVEGALLYALLRYRHRPGTDVLPKQTHGNTRLEIGWTIAPTLLMAVIAIPTVSTVYNLAPKHTADSVDVTVVGHQWWWEFQYPSLGVVTANELHIPTGRRINLVLHSIDVIHAFHVPELAGQLDVVPGHSNEMWIQADHPGTYLGQCTQFCGTSHAFMRFRVIADDSQTFDSWVINQKAPPVAPAGDATKGAALFAAGACIGCHTIQGVSQGKVGPNLTHFADRSTFAGSSLDNTPDNVQKWIHDPQSVKPEAKMPNLKLPDQDVADIVKYLETLK